MVWRIEFDGNVDKELAEIGSMQAARILRFLHDRVAQLDDPRSIGEAALKGSKPGDFWKYRVGDYRIIAHIEDEILRILVLRIGDQKEVYRG